MFMAMYYIGEFKFINEEWPAMLNRITQLGLNLEDLPRSTKDKQEEDS